jgi:glycosyltransferase involved in cell wall biosynthesis
VLVQESERKIDILYVDSEKTWRGGENQMRLLCEGLNNSAYRCHLALDPRGEAFQRLKDRYPVLSVKMSGSLDIPAALKISRYCREKNIRLIDAQTSNAHSLSLLVKLMMPQLKLVVHRRVDYVPSHNWLTRKKYLAESVDYFVAISKMIGHILHTYGVTREKLTVVPSAVDPLPYLQIDRKNERLALCGMLGIDPGLALIGNASALTSQKGYEVFFRAMQLLILTEKRFHCVIAGDGHLRGALEAMRVDLGLEKHVSFLGWIKQVPEFLSALDILVMPSNFEGLGTLILDATYAGCAVVASDAGGIPEMIEHRKGGLISPVGDHVLLAKHIQEAIRDPEQCQRFNEFARRHIDEHFSLQAMVRGNRQVYDLVLKSSAGE